MISWVVIMLLFWHYQKLSQLDPGVKLSYDIWPPSRYFDPAQIIDYKVLFVFHIYLIRSIIILNYINEFLSFLSYNVLFWHYQKLTQLDLGVKIS